MPSHQITPPLKLNRNYNISLHSYDGYEYSQIQQSVAHVSLQSAQRITAKVSPLLSKKADPQNVKHPKFLQGKAFR
jgi:hypothetical protein